MQVGVNLILIADNLGRKMQQKGSYFLVSFTCVKLFSAYCVVKMYSILLEAVSGQVVCKPIPTLQH